MDETDRESWSEDFFQTSHSNLRNELLYLFPPKQCLNRVLKWAHTTDMQFILIFHVFDAWPLGFGKLKSKENIRCYQLPVDFAFTIIPAEKEVKIGEVIYRGFLNKRAKQTVIVTSGLIGPVNK